MTKILIADDEVEARTVIRDIVPWEENGLVVCSEASNGEETISLIKRDKPEIILLDVRMPVIDGLGVSEYIYKNHLNIEVIILSGHDEFSYAQKAIKLGVSDYLLKPCRPEDLLASVLKSKQKQELRMQEQLDSLLDSETHLQNEYKLFFGHPYEKIFNDIKKPADFSYINTSDNEKYILDTVSTGKSTDVASLVSDFYALFCKNHCTKANVINSSLSLLLGLYNIYGKFSLTPPDNLENYLIHQKLKAVKTIQELKEKVTDLISDAAVTFKAKSNSNYIINTVTRYIKEHYDEDISLHTLASYVYITPAYLSMIFKQVTGTNYIDYLNKIRIEHACTLLKNLELKTYEIANMVGYSNEKYFYCVFKRITGYNPSTFRKLIL